MQGNGLCVCQKNCHGCIRQPDSADGNQLCWGFAFVAKLRVRVAGGRRLMKEKCSVHNLIGLQSFSVSEAQFFLAKADPYRVCYSCRIAFQRIIQSGNPCWESHSEPFQFPLEHE
jgi:hypothetical protein